MNDDRITYRQLGQLIDGRDRLLPGAEDADEGGIRDADVVTRKGPAAGGGCGALVVMVPVAVGEVPVRCR